MADIPLGSLNPNPVHSQKATTASVHHATAVKVEEAKAKGHSDAPGPSSTISKILHAPWIKAGSNFFASAGISKAQHKAARDITGPLLSANPNAKAKNLPNPSGQAWVGPLARQIPVAPKPVTAPASNDISQHEAQLRSARILLKQGTSVDDLPPVLQRAYLQGERELKGAAHFQNQSRIFAADKAPAQVDKRSTGAKLEEAVTFGLTHTSNAVNQAAELGLDKTIRAADHLVQSATGETARAKADQATEQRLKEHLIDRPQELKRIAQLRNRDESRILHDNDPEIVRRRAIQDQEAKRSDELLGSRKNFEAKLTSDPKRYEQYQKNQEKTEESIARGSKPFDVEETVGYGFSHTGATVNHTIKVVTGMDAQERTDQAAGHAQDVALKEHYKDRPHELQRIMDQRKRDENVIRQDNDPEIIRQREVAQEQQKRTQELVQPDPKFESKLRADPERYEQYQKNQAKSEASIEQGQSVTAMNESEVRAESRETQAEAGLTQPHAYSPQQLAHIHRHDQTDDAEILKSGMAKQQAMDKVKDVVSLGASTPMKQGHTGEALVDAALLGTGTMSKESGHNLGLSLEETSQAAQLRQVGAASDAAEYQKQADDHKIAASENIAMIAATIGTSGLVKSSGGTLPKSAGAEVKAEAAEGAGRPTLVAASNEVDSGAGAATRELKNSGTASSTSVPMETPSMQTKEPASTPPLEASGGPSPSAASLPTTPPFLKLSGKAPHGEPLPSETSHVRGSHQVESPGQTPAASAGAPSRTPPPGSKEELTFLLAKYDPAGGLPPEQVAKGVRDLDEMLPKALVAKDEVDAISDEVASQIPGARVAKVPPKSRESALRKLIKEFDGDASRFGDLARNTIVVPGGQIDEAVALLRTKGIKVKDGYAVPNEESGYTGANGKTTTENGIRGEIQVNSPEMIYAKESEENARAILGDRVYDKIRDDVKLPGGQGHALYEKSRLLSSTDPEKDLIDAESRAYYKHIRGY